MSILEQKTIIREQILKLRLGVDSIFKESYDRWICDSIWELIENRDYKTVHVYLPMGTEININSLIDRLLLKEIRVIAPKTLPNRKLQNLVLKSLNELENGVFGTKHPANAEVYSGKYDLIVVPGLAFDDSKNRLGYGGGYYDSFLAEHPESYRLGVFYPFQKVERIPLEKHDLQLDQILVQSPNDDMSRQ